MAITSNRLANQGLWIGGGFGTMDDTALYLKGQLGMVIVKADIAYQLVQFKSTTGSIAVGTPVCWSDSANFVVSSTNTDMKRNQPAGVALGTQTAANYGWIQVYGNHTAILTDVGSTASAGDTLIMSATDGKVDKVTAGTAATYEQLAIATAGTSAGATAGQIIVPHNGW